MHRIVAGRIPSGLNDEGQRAYYTVAALIASQPRSDFVEPDPSEGDPEFPRSNGRRFGGSLGTLFAEAVAAAPGRERQMRGSTAERRLNLLTRQSVDGLHRHLPASIRYLREIGVTVDWAELLDDLLAWPVHSGRITRRWLQDYYRLRAKAEAEEAQRADREELESSPRGPDRRRQEALSARPLWKEQRRRRTPCRPQHDFIDVHVLQSVPFANLNRDDTNSVKTVQYGNALRTRVSSQSWKRAVRRALPGAHRRSRAPYPAHRRARHPRTGRRPWVAGGARCPSRSAPGCGQQHQIRARERARQADHPQHGVHERDGLRAGSGRASAGRHR